MCLVVLDCYNNGFNTPKKHGLNNSLNLEKLLPHRRKILGLLNITEMEMEPYTSGPTMIGMIRARKLATKIKKRAQFLVSERRRRDNAGKAAIVHRDFPQIHNSDNFLAPKLHHHGLKTPITSRSPSVTPKLNHGLYSSSFNPVHEYKQSFKTEPAVRFSSTEVKDVIEEVLSEYLEGHSYDYDFCKDTSKKLSEVIKQRVKYLGFTRYKLICIVYMGQVKNQGMRIGSRCLWNTQFDNVAEGTFRNGELFAVATVFGSFYE